MKKKKASKPAKKVQKKTGKKKKIPKSAGEKKLKKKTVVSKSKRKPKAKKAAPPKVSFGPLVAEVTHYFPRVQAAVVKVKAPKLCLGDNLHFKGQTTDFKLKLISMQLDHQAIQEAGKGAEIGVRVPSRVREGDRVYRPVS